MNIKKYSEKYNQNLMLTIYHEYGYLTSIIKHIYKNDTIL